MHQPPLLPPPPQLHGERKLCEHEQTWFEHKFQRKEDK